MGEDDRRDSASRSQNAAASRRNNIAALSDNTNRLVTEEGRPAAQDLRKAIASVQQASDNLNNVLTDARPGIQNFSKSTLPAANRLVHELQDLSQSLQAGDRPREPAGHRRSARA